MSWLLEDMFYQKYLAACRRGIANFRSDETIEMIIENSSVESGAEYLELLKNVLPDIIGYYPLFKTSDEIGNPATYAIGDHIWSPTTLRYVKTLSDLILHFGSLDGLNIIEIGGGYGGLCKIIHDIFQPASYRILDLNEARTLQDDYLRHFNIQLQHQYFANNIDIVIACSSWSELDERAQWLYFHEIINHSKRGYFQLNYNIDFSFSLLKKHWPNLIEEDMFYGVLPSQAYEPYNKIVIC